MPEPVLYRVSGGLARLTLNRPERRNALSLGMLESVAAALASAAEDPEARVLCLLAEGPAFCAGMDLKDGDLRDPTEADRHAKAFSRVYRSLLTLPIPLFCAVNGPATGGGVGLPASADLVWAGSGARFALPETRVGLVPALVSVVLTQRMSPKRLMGMAVGGAAFDGEGAAGVGLVDFVVDDAREECLSFARDFLRDHSAEATRRTKEFLLERSSRNLDGALESAEEEFRRAVATDAASRGLEAFSEKRSVAWDEDSQVT